MKDIKINASNKNPKLKKLEDTLREIALQSNIQSNKGEKTSEIIVAFSGGVDSSLLAKVATDVLGKKALIVTAISPSLATLELNHCEKLAKEWDLNWIKAKTSELDCEQYQKNDIDRCYWCKDSLMDALIGLSPPVDNPVDNLSKMSKIVPPIVLGVNLDDLSDHRPGIDAAKKRGAIFPFLLAELSKQDVRDISKELGLETWDKPAEPCLASRIPFGTKVSEEILHQIDMAESNLKELGFANIRVRHHNDTARLEIPEADFHSLLNKKPAVIKAIKSAGYKFVALDLEGLRTGSLLPVNLRNTKK